MSQDWLAWGRRLQALAQNGLTYATDPFDVERYEQLRDLAAEMVAGLADRPPAAIAGLWTGEAGYATPKLDVRGVLFDGDRVLLVKEKSDGLWTLPGGWADVGEAPAEAVTKEIREEAGLETRAVKLLAVLDRDKQGHPPIPWHIWKLVFLCEVVGGTPAAGAETDDVGFFALDALPPLSLRRVLPQQIARFFAHRANPAWPTDFD